MTKEVSLYERLSKRQHLWVDITRTLNQKSFSEMLSYHLTLQEEFENLKDEYKDIFLMGPSDISITDLSEMTIDTKEDAIPYAARPYKLALQHQDFLR